MLKKLSPDQVSSSELAGEEITDVLTEAPGNDAAIGGLKVVSAGRLVRGAAVGHRGRLQGLRRELPRRGAPRADRRGGAGDREGGARADERRLPRAHHRPRRRGAAASWRRAAADPAPRRARARPDAARARRAAASSSSAAASAGCRRSTSCATSDVDVTLIDRRNFHLFQPLVYQVATGALSPGEIATPLRSVFKRAQERARDAGRGLRDRPRAPRRAPCTRRWGTCRRPRCPTTS